MFCNHVLAGPLPTGQMDIQNSWKDGKLVLFQKTGQDLLKPLIDLCPYLVSVHFMFKS